jgi:hypothetical protein
MTKIREAIPMLLLSDAVTPAVPSRLLHDQACLAAAIAVAEATG